MKKIALGLVALAGFASLAACKTNQQTYRPAPNYTAPTYGGPTYSGPTQPAPYSGPTYGTPTAPRGTTPPPAPRAACGGGKCG